LIGYSCTKKITKARTDDEASPRGEKITVNRKRRPPMGDKGKKDKAKDQKQKIKQQKQKEKKRQDKQPRKTP